MAPLLMKVRAMPTNILSLADLESVRGGITAAQWTQIKDQAAPYCPNTVKKYGNIDPSTLTQSKAQGMANACVAEMPGWEQGIARGQINSMLGEAFPAKK
jgi:hypothetical protein